MKNNKAITMISLVVTIVILIILAGVSINMVVGDNSLVNISKKEANESEKKSLIEEIRMELLDKKVETIGRELTQDEIKLILEKYGVINYQNSTMYSLTPFDKDYEILIDELYEFIEAIKILEYDENIVMTEGDIKKLEFNYTGIAVSKEFISSNTENVTIDSTTGDLTALKAGTAKITVKLTNKNGEVTIANWNVKVVDKVTITDYVESLTMVAGNSITLDLSYTGAIKSKEFISSNDAITTVDSETGTLQAIAAGTSTVTVKLINENDVEVTKSCNVTVLKAIAKVGTTYYSSITNAINAISSSGTITMCDSTTESPTIPSGKTITLSLNNKTITGIVRNEGILTIGGGTVQYTSNSRGYALWNSGTLTINSGTYRNNVGGYTVYNKTGTLNFNGGNIVYGYADNGTALISSEGTVRMKGGTVSSTAHGIVISAGTGAITGGTIASSSHIALLYQGTGTGTVSGATIKQTGSGYSISNQTKSNYIHMSNCTISGTVNAGSGKYITHIKTASTSYTCYVWGITSSAANVKFPTWTAKNGQDDIIWGLGTKGTVNNVTCWYYTVTKSAHNNESGTYNTHIYWYNSADTSTYVTARSLTV